MTRGVGRRERSPLSEEVKAELARVPLRSCDAQVLAALLPQEPQGMRERSHEAANVCEQANFHRRIMPSVGVACFAHGQAQVAR